MPNLYNFTLEIGIHDDSIDSIDIDSAIDDIDQAIVNYGIKWLAYTKVVTSQTEEKGQVTEVCKDGSRIGNTSLARWC